AFVAPLFTLLRQRKLDDAAMRLRHAFGERPINLLRIPPAQGFRQRRGRRKRAGNNNHAGRVTVEAMYEARPLALVALKAVKHAIDMARDTGAALARDTARFVQN